MAPALLFQMRGLEQISGTRHSERGLDGSRRYSCVHVVTLRTVTHCYCYYGDVWVGGQVNPGAPWRAVTCPDQVLRIFSPPS